MGILRLANGQDASVSQNSSTPTSVTHSSPCIKKDRFWYREASYSAYVCGYSEKWPADNCPLKPTFLIQRQIAKKGSSRKPELPRLHVFTRWYGSQRTL